MKKILFLIHDLGQGGAEKVLINLVNNMNADKFDITVMTLFDVGVNKQFLAPRIHYKTVFTRVFPGNSQVMKLFSPEFLHRQFIKDHYDIEVSYLEGPCARIISACPEKKTKKVCWIHIEQKSTEKASRSFRSKREAEKCYNKYDNIVCVSKTVQEDFSKIFSIRTSTEVLYNTNECDKIRALSKESVTECCIRSDEIKLVGVGKLLKSKGFDRILRVVERLRADGYPIHFYLLGIGPEEENLRGYVDEHGLSKSVNLLGYRTNPYKFVKKCDLFVCASYAEGFSTATTEALIVGTPVCTVEVSGMREMLGENNEYGVVVANEEEALYDGIKELIDNPALLAHYRSQAQIRGKMFSTENTVRAVEAMIEELYANE